MTTERYDQHCQEFIKFIQTPIRRELFIIKKKTKNYRICGPLGAEHLALL